MEVITQEAAKAAGRKFFFTGEPCRKGHVAERYTTGWACVECSREYNSLSKEERTSKGPAAKGTRDIAREAGRIIYDFGKPCVKGHTSGRYVSNGYCAGCTKDKADAWQKNNADKISDRKKRYRKVWLSENKNYAVEYYHKNASKILAKRKEYYARASETIRERHKRFRRRNPHKMAEYAGKRRASERRAVPKWLNKTQRREIEAIYAESRALTLQTGVPHHVDHIVPLRGKLVCGLHVPWNLRVIPAKENIRKSNKIEEVAGG